jgi:Cu(I)/Ag(I) efflux system membrane fusion protein
MPSPLDGPTPQPSPASRGQGGLIVRAVFVRLRLALVFLATALVAFSWDALRDRWEAWTEKAPAAQASGPTEYYCPMHPLVVKNEPGTCPTCNMALSARARVASTGARITLPPRRIEQAGVATSLVKRLPLEARVQLVGTLEIDEARHVKVASRVGGLVTHMFAHTPGTPVERGDPLAWVYNRKVAELLAERRATEMDARAEEQGLAPDHARIESLRARMKRLNELLTVEGALPDLYPRHAPAFTHTALPPIGDVCVEERSPIAGVVLMMSVMEGDLVKEGASLYEVADTSWLSFVGHASSEEAGLLLQGSGGVVVPQQAPAERITCVLAHVEPALDPASRTVKVVLEVPNSASHLLAGGIATATLLVPASGVEPSESMIRGAVPKEISGDEERYGCLGIHAPYISEKPGNCVQCGSGLRVVRYRKVLAIPASAVIDTGTRRVAYKEVAPGAFVPVEIGTGRRCGDLVEVTSGLAENEKVVSQGAFLVDAETRLDPAASSAYYGASKPQ